MCFASSFLVILFPKKKKTVYEIFKARDLNDAISFLVFWKNKRLFDVNLYYFHSRVLFISIIFAKFITPSHLMRRLHVSSLSLVTSDEIEISALFWFYFFFSCWSRFPYLLFLFVYHFWFKGNEWKNGNVALCMYVCVRVNS